MGIILAMVDMAIMDTMVRGLLMLSQLPLLSQLLLLSLQPLLSLDIFMAMDMVMDTILAMDMDTMDMDTMDMDMDMAMVMDTMVKQICCSFLEFSTNEVDQTDPVKRNTLFMQLKYILKNRKKK